MASNGDPRVGQFGQPNPEGYRPVPGQDIPLRPMQESHQGYQQPRTPDAVRLRMPTDSARRLQRHLSDAPSYHSDSEDEDAGITRRRSSRRDGMPPELMNELPSKKLQLDQDQATAVQTILRTKSLNRKSKHNKKLGYATVRLRHGAPVDTEDIVDGLMNNPNFAAEPEELQHDDIKELATNMKNKREIRDRVHVARSSRKQHVRPGWFKRVGYNVSLGMKRFKDNVAEVTYSIELWKGHLKKIEGHFGTGVTSYFLFLKWLFLLNIPVFFLSFAFVVTPQILVRWYKPPIGYPGNNTFTGKELLTGGGWFLNTELYYGFYGNSPNVTQPTEIISGAQYDMRYAYLLTCAGYYLLTLIIVTVSMSKSYKRNYIESSGEFNFYYVSKVLCGWDYTITDPEASLLKHKALFKELQEYMAGFRKGTTQRTCCQWCGLFIFRVFTNLFVLGLLAGSGYIIWYISVTQSLKTNIELIGEMAMPLCISAINFILPFAFSILASFERYEQPRHELYITMVRTILLNGVTLGVLVYFWYSGIRNDLTVEACWENVMGQQIYRLVIVDFIFILVITFVAEFIRRLMSAFCCKKLGHPEFNIGRNTLNLIYSQALCWLGTFYSPLLSFIMIMKLFIIFYVKRISVMQNCVPSVKPWRAGRTHTIILGLLFLGFLLCMIAVFISVGFIKPSSMCGPYRGYNASYDVVVELFEGWQGDVVWFKDILEYITSVGFIVFILTALCVTAYYCRVMAIGREEMVKLLKHQLALEGKDKAFLLNLYREADSGKYTRPGATPGGKVSHTPGSKFAAAAKSPALKASQESARPLGGSAGPSSQGTQKPSIMGVFNQGYLDNSWDEQTMAQQPSLDPRGASSGQPASANNPGYSDRSPTLKPNLPYPGPHYSKYGNAS